MAIVEPGKGRAIIEHKDTGLRITIPARTRFLPTAIAILFSPLWIFGEIAVIYKLVTEPLSSGTAFFAFWFTIWTLGGLWSLSSLLWNLSGKEVIDLDAVTLRRRKQIPLFSRSREYAVAGIAALRLAPPRIYGYYYQQDMSFLHFNDTGAIAFDHGRDTCRLGAGLDQAEASHVIKEMLRSVPALGAFDTTLPEDA